MPSGAHAATSISAALGFLRGQGQRLRDNKDRGHRRRSMSAGWPMISEQRRSHHQAADPGLNDNDMSTPASGRDERLLGPAGLRGPISRCAFGRAIAVLPKSMKVAPAKPRNTPEAWSLAALFEELGLLRRPDDGHDLDALVAVLKNARESNNQPVLVHVVTQRARATPAETPPT